MITLRFYRIYDIGREIDLDWLEQALAQSLLYRKDKLCPCQAEVHHD